MSENSDLLRVILADDVFACSFLARAASGTKNKLFNQRFRNDKYNTCDNKEKFETNLNVKTEKQTHAHQQKRNTTQNITRILQTKTHARQTILYSPSVFSSMVYSRSDLSCILTVLIFTRTAIFFTAPGAVNCAVIEKFNFTIKVYELQLA
jgi:hypothetical protein